MLQPQEKKQATAGQEKPPLTLQHRRDEPAGTQNTLAHTGALLSLKSGFGCDAPLRHFCNDGAEPNTPSRTLQAVARRDGLLLPPPNAPSGAPSRDRLESLGWTLLHRLNAVPFPSVTCKFSLQ